MGKRYTERSLLEFQRTFATEEACARPLQALRWPGGFACPRCGHGEAWYIRTRQVLDCKGCRAQISVTAGTIFHKTRTPLVKWYWLLYRMAMGKVGVSIAEMQRGLEINDYKTAWLMAHKVRKAMADRDARYRLTGLVEMDESFFGPRGTRRGRGSERKRTVLCAVALYRDRAGRERPGFAHMRVVEDASATTVEAFLDRLGCGAPTEGGGGSLGESGQGQGPGALQGRPARSPGGGEALAVGPSRYLQRQSRHPGGAPRGLREAPPTAPL